MIRLLLICACLGCAIAAAQTPLAFEVATIKPAPPLNPADLAAGKLHVGMKVDAGRVDIGFLSLAELIPMAFKVKPYQVSGLEGVNVNRFDILARIPDGVDKEKVPEMLQALLAERFNLKFHRESKDQSIYALVEAKGGHKLKEAAPDEAPAADAAKEEGASAGDRGGPAALAVKRGADGRSFSLNAGGNGSVKMAMGEGGNMRMELSKAGMGQLADMLSRFVDRPVVDMTGLKGNCQVALDITLADMMSVARASGMAAPGLGGAGLGPDAGARQRPADTASDPSGGSVFQSVQQMGLRLESRKSPVEVIVIDHVDKTPTEN